MSWHQLPHREKTKTKSAEKTETETFLFLLWYSLLLFICGFTVFTKSTKVLQDAV